MNNPTMVPPFLLGETEWPDAITSGDLLFHIPIQLFPETTRLDLTGNMTYKTTTNGVGDCILHLSRPAAGVLRDTMDAINLLHDEVFWDDTTKAIKGVIVSDLGAVYKGINYIFQDNKSGGDLLCFATQRTSSTSPSIEQVAGYLSLNVGDIFSFDGTHFRIGDTIITI